MDKVEELGPYPYVVAGCPVRDRGWIIDEYMDCLVGLDYPPDKLSFLFLLNDSIDETEDKLEIWREELRGRMAVHSIRINPKAEWLRSHRPTYWNLATARNVFVDLFLWYGGEYLFSVDSDILVPPCALKRLLGHKKDLCAGLVCNSDVGSPKEIGYRQYNAMNLSADGGADRNEINIPESGLIQVGLSGAVILMKRKVLENPRVRYGDHYLGEDVPFCHRVNEEGYKIWVDCGLRPEHIMDRREYVTGELRRRVNDAL